MRNPQLARPSVQRFPNRPVACRSRASDLQATDINYVISSAGTSAGRQGLPCRFDVVEHVVGAATGDPGSHFFPLSTGTDGGRHHVRAVEAEDVRIFSMSAKLRMTGSLKFEV